MKKLQNKDIIISHDSSDLIGIYIKPSNFRKDNKNRWIFDCKKIILVMPKRYKKSPPKIMASENLTETIVHEDEWYTYNEWSTNSNKKLLMSQIFI